MEFNTEPSEVLHVDLNSCFATIEQQANPLLRGKPIAVAAYNSPRGCILAPSVEAKRFGVKVGMRVMEGRALCPSIRILTPDPNKYRHVHLGLRRIVSSFTPNFDPKSIDEFVLNLKGCPAIAKDSPRSMWSVGETIKKRIKAEIGDAITVSVGIAPNRFLAKTASGLHKPDGLDEINKDNYLNTYSNLKLTDLCGIKKANATRLAGVGVKTLLDFYNCPIQELKTAFGGIFGYYWYLRLRGYEIDDFVSKRKSYGNSYALPKPFLSKAELSPIISKLTEKMAGRLRRGGYKARGVHLSILYRGGGYWHMGRKLPFAIFDTKDIYNQMISLFNLSEGRPVAIIAVSVFALEEISVNQLALFEDVIRKENLVKAVDAVNTRWGEFTLASGRMLGTDNFVKDRIAFGGVAELVL